MGNQKFGVSVLQKFYEETDHTVVAVLCEQDIVGKSINPIKKYAENYKIPFFQPKNYKDKKLLGVITSSEYKFWKLISGRKYLNQNSVSFDERLLNNFYKNNGFYNVKINSSFAKLLDDNTFEDGTHIDWGDTVRGTSADRTFRVKNNSATLTANSIQLSTTVLTNTTPSLVNQFEYSDGGAFAQTLDIGNLAPGAISPLITVRRNTDISATLSVWTARIDIEPTSWS